MTDLTPSSPLAGPAPDDETMRTARAALLAAGIPIAEGSAKTHAGLTAPELRPASIAGSDFTAAPSFALTKD
jgi:hypothetical protein